jgi:hypothetical protein
MVRYVLDGLWTEAKDQIGSRHHEHFDLTCTCLVVIEGGCRRWHKERGDYVGADYFAEMWCDRRHVAHEQYPADWEQYGKAAGMMRNRQMLEEGKPDLVVAFHDDIAASKGTKNMVDIARAAGVETHLVSHA